MPESHTERSPLLRLVLFMVCLSVAGSIVAGVHYAAVDRPQQEVLQAPTNSDSDTDWNTLGCTFCNSGKATCEGRCTKGSGYTSCMNECQRNYDSCIMGWGVTC